MLNFDGSVKGDTSAADFWFRNFEGIMVSASSFNLGNNPVMIAEVIGLKKGILQAINMNIRSIVIEGDNLLVINVVMGK